MPKGPRWFAKKPDRIFVDQRPRAKAASETDKLTGSTPLAQGSETHRQRTGLLPPLLSPEGPRYITDELTIDSAPKARRLQTLGRQTARQLRTSRPRVRDASSANAVGRGLAPVRSTPAVNTNDPKTVRAWA